MAGRRVLILDDERLTRLSLVDFMTEMGFDAVGVADGMSAIALQQERPFDYCIVDIHLPGIDGVETIIALHRIAPHSRFIIYTGSPQFVLAPVLEEIGISDRDVVFKPVLDMSVFVRLIARYEGAER